MQRQDASVQHVRVGDQQLSSVTCVTSVSLHECKHHAPSHVKQGQGERKLGRGRGLGRLGARRGARGGAG